MNDQEKLRRLLEIIIYLSSGIKRSINEISERFGISDRTAFRYIQTFRDAGFVIPKPHDGLYQISKDSPYFREISELLHFSVEEAMILQKTIHSISNENLLKQNLIKKLYSLYDFGGVANTIVKQEHSENIHQIIRAIKNKNRVVFKGYQSANSNNATNRTVEPFGFTTNYIATWAFDLKSGECKTFKNTRIKEVQILSEKWENESDHKKQLMDVFRISCEKQLPVKLKLSIRACELLKEEYPLAENFIKPINNNEFVFKTEVCSYEGVGRFVMGLYNEITILESNGLKKFIAERAKKIVADGS
jgi:predicted DNA-binding transcriptional regulator YafY